MAPQAVINWAIYNSLPLEEARYQLAHINDSERVATLTSYIVSVSICLLAVIMRFVSRRIGRTKYGADDWIMLAATVLVLADSTSGLLAATIYGGAHHAILMTENESNGLAKSNFASSIFYFPAIGMVKISTLLLFGRIFPLQKFHRILRAVGLFISIYSVISTTIMIFHCRPLRGAWDPTVEPDCMDLSKLLIFMGSMNVLTDFLLLCLPLPQLWKLQMRRGTKMQVIGIFTIGSFTTIVSIYRIPQLRDMESFKYDPSWSIVKPGIWSVVELAAATLGACAITYRALFHWVFRIQTSPSWPQRKPTLADATTSYHLNTRANLATNIGHDIKTQALNVFHPSVPEQSHSSRTTRTEGGF